MSSWRASRAVLIFGTAFLARNHSTTRKTPSSMKNVPLGRRKRLAVIGDGLRLGGE